MTFIEAANEILKLNGNKPMSSNEIWDGILSLNLMKNNAKTPKASLNVLMLSSSNNSNIKRKSKKINYTIVSKNPTKFKRIDDEVIDVDFDITSDEILQNINLLKRATTEIDGYISDVNALCLGLNNVDRNYLHKYYSSDKTGVVIDIRKDVAKEILLGTVDINKIDKIILNHKEINGHKLKSWLNPYKILHPLVNYKYKDLDIFIERFVKFLCSKIGDVKYTISNFDGSQHQGSSKYWIAIYNSTHKSQSDALQIFMEFSGGDMRYGVYNYLEGKHMDRNVFNGDVDKLYDFIDSASELILNNTKTSLESLIENVKKIIEDNGNIPMTISDILSKMDNNMSVFDLKHIMDGSDVFEQVDSGWRISGQIPGTNKLKSYLVDQGFITYDMLFSILNKNGIKLEKLEL